MKRAAALLLCAGCLQGASNTPAPPVSAPPAATGLTYVDPPPQGWRLVRDPGSTPTRLLLDLVGPSGLQTRGAAFNLQLPIGVRARSFDETRFPVRDLGIYELLNSQPLPNAPAPEPVLLAGAVKPGNLLTVGVFQKDRRVTAKESGVPLFQIALELDPAYRVIVGQRLDLNVTKAKYIAGDIGAFSPVATLEMVAKAVMQDYTLATGELHAE